MSHDDEGKRGFSLTIEELEDRRAPDLIFIGGQEYYIYNDEAL